MLLAYGLDNEVLLGIDHMHCTIGISEIVDQSSNSRTSIVGQAPVGTVTMFRYVQPR